MLGFIGDTFRHVNDILKHMKDFLVYLKKLQNEILIRPKTFNNLNNCFRVTN